jgi:ubiquitin-protein ligase
VSVSAHHIRREEDHKKIRNLVAEYAEVLDIVKVMGNPMSSIELHLTIPTAANRNYPKEVQNNTSVRIELTSRYPFDPPKVTVLSPVFNPNIYSSGLVCLGPKWLPTNGLDLLVLRIMRLLTFDPFIVNVQSPANGEACTWYKEAKKKYPQNFPSVEIDRLKQQQEKPKIAWKDVTLESGLRIIVTCLDCGQKLRVPSGKRGTVSCPKCGKSFNV